LASALEKGCLNYWIATGAVMMQLKNIQIFLLVIELKRFFSFFLKILFHHIELKRLEFFLKKKFFFTYWNWGCFSSMLEKWPWKFIHKSRIPF
jgi:hypothetical protein